MNKIIRIMLLLIIFTCSLSLLGCDTLIENDIKEGTYASSNLEYYYKEAYIQMNCTFKRISKREFDKSDKNVLEKRTGILNKYYSVEMFIKEQGMEDYCKVDLSNISSYKLETGTLQYKGDFCYQYKEKIVEDVFEISLFYETDISVEMLGIRHELFYETYKIDIKEYKYKTFSTNIDPKYKKSKLSIKEISEEEFSYENPNQFQALYGRQYLEIEFYIFIEETNTYEKTFLTFEGYSGFRGPYHKDHYYGTGYFLLDGEINEFTFKLMLESEIEVEIYSDADCVNETHYYEIVK